MLKQSLEDSVNVLNDVMADAKMGLDMRAKMKYFAEDDLGVTLNYLKANIAELADSHHECMTKTQDFEAEVTSR